MKRIFLCLSLIIILIILPGCQNYTLIRWNVDIHVKNNTNKIIAFKIDGQSLEVPPGQNYKVTVKYSRWVLDYQNPTEPEYEVSFYRNESQYGYNLSYIDGTAEVSDALLLKEREPTIQLYIIYSDELHRLIVIR